MQFLLSLLTVVYQINFLTFVHVYKSVEFILFNIEFPACFNNIIDSNVYLIVL